MTPRLALRMAILSGVLLAVFAALFLRLWALQVIQGSKYVDQAQANSFRIVPVQAPRGTILDRNRVQLVTNVPATSVQLWPADLPKVYTQRYRDAEAACAGHAGAALRDRARHQAAARRERPRHAADDPRGRERPDGRLPRRALVRVSGRHHRPVVRAPLPVPGPRRAGARLRRLDHARSSSTSLGKGYGPNDEIGQAGRRVGLRQLPPRRERRLAAPRRLARPAARRRAADRRAEAGSHGAAHPRREAPAGRREGARLRHPARA